VQCNAGAAQGRTDAERELERDVEEHEQELVPAGHVREVREPCGEHGLVVRCTGHAEPAELDVEAAMDEEDVGAEAAEAPAGEARRRARSVGFERRVMRIA
jgi:hypothetical protein